MALKASLLVCLAALGRHGRWVLPVGLLAGLVLPWAAQPMRMAIPWLISVLLFLATLRILNQQNPLVSGEHAQRASSGRKAEWIGAVWRVLLAQLLLPVLIILIGLTLGLPAIVCLAAGLVAGAPPVTGSPNLVLLLGGDAAMSLHWLLVGTALLPLTCLPVLALLFPAESITIMFRPSLMLLMLIVSAAGLAWVIHRVAQARSVALPADVLDGASALALALVVIGLMAGVHLPSTGAKDVLLMMSLAVVLNAGLQWLGTRLAIRSGQGRQYAIGTGVATGNRNIALYLSALPAAQMEPLLLFIACYQIPMYMTPLIGDLFYRRLE